MCKTGLHYAESSHCSTRWVVGPNCVSVDYGIVALVWALSVRNAIDEHRRGGAGVSATVKDHARFNLDDLSVLVRVVTHPDGCGMTMHVPEEAFLAAVLHLDRSASAQGEETTVNLQADVFACAKGSADSTENEANIVFWKVETGSYLSAVFVQPLRCDVQFHALSAWIGEGHGCLKAEKGLILHANCVIAFHDDVTSCIRITMNDALMSNQVAIRMNWWSIRENC